MVIASREHTHKTLGFVMITFFRSLLSPSPFRKGQLVEVLTAAEIASTLDGCGTVDGLPFMPEMAKFCGRRMRVHRRADKTCIEGQGMRRLSRTVFLEEARCDGAAHDGCQRGCLMFWNESWLKPVDDKRSGAIRYSNVNAISTDRPQNEASCDGLLQRLRTRHGNRYYCQSTELPRISGYLSPWNFTHFLLELRYGEVSFGELVRIVVRTLVNRARATLGVREIHGLVGPGTNLGKGDLALKAGEWIEVKKPAEIEKTLNAHSRNRGLLFETDMLAFAGRRYRVSAPVHRIILEETGQMIELTNTVVLDGVTCKGLCSKNCPRANPLFWREAWLSRPNMAISEQTSPSEPCAGAALDRARETRNVPMRRRLIGPDVK